MNEEELTQEETTVEEPAAVEEPALEESPGENLTGEDLTGEDLTGDELPGEEIYAEDILASGGSNEISVMAVVEEERPFLTTDLNDYSVTEGLLLLILLFLVIQALIKIVKGGFYWLW